MQVFIIRQRLVCVTMLLSFGEGVRSSGPSHAYSDRAILQEGTLRLRTNISFYASGVKEMQLLLTNTEAPSLSVTRWPGRACHQQHGALTTTLPRSLLSSLITICTHLSRCTSIALLWIAISLARSHTRFERRHNAFHRRCVQLQRTR